jgi:hypothetical protein
LARKVWNGEPIDLAMGYFNALWQADANAMALECFAHAASPPFIVNLAGAETISVRTVCEDFGRMFDCEPKFVGVEASDALLSNSQLSQRLFGAPRRSQSEMVRCVAAWVRRGGGTLDKPTHFEARDGRF